MYCDGVITLWTQRAVFYDRYVMPMFSVVVRIADIYGMCWIGDVVLWN